MLSTLHKFSTSTLTALVLAAVSNSAYTHDINGIPIDAAGNNASATDLAQIVCFDNGNGKTEYLGIQIGDNSPPVPGLIVNVQISKDNKMTNISDNISADGKPSPFTYLRAGDGVYYVSVNKTAAGLRNFNLTFHCLTNTNEHTGTDIGGVLQIQQQ